MLPGVPARALVQRDDDLLEVVQRQVDVLRLAQDLPRAFGAAPQMRAGVSPVPE